MTLSPVTVEFSPFDDPALEAAQPYLDAQLFKTSPNKFRYAEFEYHKVWV